MKTFRLVYRASHREANSTYVQPRFRLQLPEYVLNDGTHKEVEIVLEQFSGYIHKNTAEADDTCVIKLRGITAKNSVQTSGAGVFEGGNTLGIATLTHEHTNENFLTTQYPTEYGLKLLSNYFNNGFIEFDLQHITGTSIGIPNTAALREYVITLCIKVDY